MGWDFLKILQSLELRAVIPKIGQICSRLAWLQGQLEVTRGPLSELRLDPNLASVALDDFFANGQANARAAVFVAGVQALKDN
jgi:hypothetical protein